MFKLTPSHSQQQRLRLLSHQSKQLLTFSYRSLAFHYRKHDFYSMARPQCRSSLQSNDLCETDVACVEILRGYDGFVRIRWEEIRREIECKFVWVWEIFLWADRQRVNLKGIKLFCLLLLFLLNLKFIECLYNQSPNNRWVGGWTPASFLPLPSTLCPTTRQNHCLPTDA